MSEFAVREALEANARERRRLGLLVGSLDEARLAEVVHDRWTVAAKLAHLAYWDRFALLLLERWALGEGYETDTLPGWHDDTVNDAQLDGWLALPPMEAARLAIEAAEAIDGRLEGLDPVDAERLLTDRDAEWLLRRHRHRAEHVVEIDVALGLRAVDSHLVGPSDYEGYGAPHHPHRRPLHDRGSPRPSGTRTYLGGAQRTLRCQRRPRPRVGRFSCPEHATPRLTDARRESTDL